MSIFDPQAFLDSTTSESNDTFLAPCPIGEWPATVEAVDFKTGTISKGERTGEPWHKLNIKWKIVGTPANDEVQRDTILVTQGLMLDITDSGGLDMGKGRNTRLGAVREAVGLNTNGVPFSPRMLLGRSAKVSISHREYEGRMVDDVKGVIPL